jgi:hypothetical protein
VHLGAGHHRRAYRGERARSQRPSAARAGAGLPGLPVVAPSDVKTVTDQEHPHEATSLMTGRDA